MLTKVALSLEDNQKGAQAPQVCCNHTDQEMVQNNINIIFTKIKYLNHFIRQNEFLKNTIMLLDQVNHFPT